MASDINDRLSIKNLLFTKAMPNLVIPFNTEGYKTYPCIDCGDRFVFKSSYEYHVNRKSVVITYMCRHCNQVRTFNNRCNLLSHIRSHAFKTATINVSDLKVDPLPASYFESLAAKHGLRNNTKVTDTESTNSRANKNKKPNKFSCLECKKEIPVTSLVYKDRAHHFMQYTNKVHACPVCLFALPTICGLRAHLRLHTICAPFYCPECGITLTKRMIQYPYSHDCEGFRMMRATARYRCPLQRCYLFHPNEYKTHMRTNHLKKVFKCPLCVVACFNEITIAKHLASHPVPAKAIIFYQCEMCPGRLVLHNQLDNHLRSHISNSAFVYPCWACGQVFRDVPALLKHYSSVHGQVQPIRIAASTVPTPMPTTETETSPQKEAAKQGLTYRVVKRCDKCKRSFTYKCRYEQISILPNECPFKCTASVPAPEVAQESPAPATIKCHLCTKEISENWDAIKSHYASDHKNHRCLDAKLVLKKVNVKKCKRKLRREARKRFKEAFKKLRTPKTGRKHRTPPQRHINPTVDYSSSNPLACRKCGYEADDKPQLVEHFLSHKDLTLAYQCMECGECFAVKPSFRTHLIMAHSITDVDEYVEAKQCYNAEAMSINKFTTDIVKVEEPLRENQCQICRDQFDDPEELQKHFRVHGMAFLMKNSNIKTSNSP